LRASSFFTQINLLVFYSTGTQPRDHIQTPGPDLIRWRQFRAPPSFFSSESVVRVSSESARPTDVVEPSPPCAVTYSRVVRRPFFSRFAFHSSLSLESRPLSSCGLKFHYRRPPVEDQILVRAPGPHWRSSERGQLSCRLRKPHLTPRRPRVPL
jgi:hypothetical protein